MEASGSKQKTQQRQGAVKRKMYCCDWNAEWRMKIKTKCRIQCDHCQCLFYQTKKRDEHMKIHECSQCHDIAIGDDAQAHNLRHRQEAQLEQLKQQRQRQMDDDFVLCYVKANRLHRYRSQLDYEPDIDFIMLNYRFEKDEWLAFVNKFKRRFLNLFYVGFEHDLNDNVWHQDAYLIKQVNAEVISYLLENGALSIHDAIDFLNILMTKIGYNQYLAVVVLHLLKKDFKIKSEWVARAINDDELIERIKEKHTFTFDEIHKARQWDIYSPVDVKALKTFYAQLQKHFFNPNFESAFDDLLDEDIENVQYSLDNICQRNRLTYDKEKDAFQLGGCAEMMQKSLAELTKQYVNELKVFAELEEKINHLNDERNERNWRMYDSDDSNESRDDYYYDDDEYDDAYYDCAIDDVEFEQKGQGRHLSKLYFVMSLK